MRERAAAIAVGSKESVERVNADLGSVAGLRDIDVSGATGVLRESDAVYNDEMTTEKRRLGGGSWHFWKDA